MRRSPPRPVTPAPGPDPVELLHDGHQTFWRTHTSLAITVADHPNFDVVEVIAYDPVHHEEAPRIYLDGKVLSSRIDVVARAQDERERDVNKRAVDFKQLQRMILQEFKRDFVLSRIQMQAGVLHRLTPLNTPGTVAAEEPGAEGVVHPSWSVCLAPTFSDHVRAETGELDVVIPRPAGLCPASIVRVHAADGSERSQRWEQTLHQFQELVHTDQDLRGTGALDATNPHPQLMPLEPLAEDPHTHPHSELQLADPFAAGPPHSPRVLAPLPLSPRAPPPVDHLHEPVDTALEAMSHADSRHHPVAAAGPLTPDTSRLVRLDQGGLSQSTSAVRPKSAGGHAPAATSARTGEPGRAVTTDDSQGVSAKSGSVKKVLLGVKKAEVAAVAVPLPEVSHRVDERERAHNSAHGRPTSHDSHGHSVHGATRRGEQPEHLPPVSRAHPHAPSQPHILVHPQAQSQMSPQHADKHAVVTSANPDQPQGSTDNPITKASGLQDGSGNDDEEEDDPAVAMLRCKARQQSLQALLVDTLQPERGATHFHHSYYDDTSPLVSPLQQLHLLGKQSALAPALEEEEEDKDKEANTVDGASAADYARSAHSKYAARLPVERAHAPSLEALHQRSYNANALHHNPSP